MTDPIESIKKFVRATNYLTVTQIYLQDNFLLDKPLKSEDIKPRLFGHWGTCPGINFVYANLNYFVGKYKQSSIFVLGPGHGFAALQANLFLEGTLGKYYDQAKISQSGIGFVSKQFAWPYGFSSHSCPEAPGLILEGGELGYSLATSFGAVMDNPDLLAVCMIGDGEAETGPLSSAWSMNKIIHPGVNGIVLPILHLNGYKISGPSIFAGMSDEDLTSLFSGHGYEPIIVGGENIYPQMFETLDYCFRKIAEIKKNPHKNPRLPMIILKTPKGWTGPKMINEEKIEGTIKAHQLVGANAKHDLSELTAIEEWLKSYKFGELFEGKKGFSEEIKELIPSDDLKIGDNKNVFSNLVYQDLKLPNSKDLAQPLGKAGEHTSNSMRAAGTFLNKVFSLNKSNENFRMMSPDETYSNRLDEIFETTSRSFTQSFQAHDKHLSHDGRVMEMLSEHNLHGLAQGYILTGRHSVFATYEAFAQIFSSMTHQYIKFLKMMQSLNWRGAVSSLNFILSSVVWRQEHNGFSHQNPSFISGVLEKNNDFVKVYFPVDDNSMLAALDETLNSKNGVNTIVAGKTPEPRWLSLEQAQESLKDGILTWDFASDKNPDVILLGIGDYMSREALAAIELVKQHAPIVNLRFVNISRLNAKCNCKDVRHEQIPNASKYLTDDKPVVVNFHGYPETIKAVLFDLPNPNRFSVHGYRENGGTTTPFDLLARNGASRYDLAIDVIEKASSVIGKDKAAKLVKFFKEELNTHKQFVIEKGQDPVDIESWRWNTKPASKLTDEEQLQTEVLNTSKIVAIVGLSDKENRPSYRVASFLKGQGYRIIPVNPNVKSVLGEKAYASLLEIPKQIKIDIVDIFRKPEEVIPHIKEALERGDVKTIWLAEGVVSQEAEVYALSYNLNMVSNFCIMEAYKKLKPSQVLPNYQP